MENVKNIKMENEEDSVYYGFIEDDNMDRSESHRVRLPAFIQEYVANAVQVSKYNNIPAALTAFNLLGQLCKDKVVIVRGQGREDTRVPVLWLQTSGTGKSEMYNFFGPISRKTFEILNEKHGTNFTIFDVTETTDAALIGSMKQEQEVVEDEDGNTRTVYVDVQTKGAFEGDGLIVYDEFEYSGVFKQSQHKENIILYLNKLMNSIHGENYIIKKKLKDGDENIICDSKRSPYATSYIPKGLTIVIAEKGVLQRMLIFIWEVPPEIQDEIRKSVIMEVGKEVNRIAPVNKFANGFVKIYETLDERFKEVNENPKEVVRYSEDYTDALMREYENMKAYVADSRPEVFEIANNFITRMNNQIIRMSVLCCIAEAPSISDKSKRYIVNSNHVLQASSLVRQCYKSLVSWLDVALKVQKETLQERANIGAFKESYLELKDDDGWVNKTMLLAEVRVKTRKGSSTIYKWWRKIEDNFEENRVHKKVYVKLKEEEK